MYNKITETGTRVVGATDLRRQVDVAEGAVGDASLDQRRLGVGQNGVNHQQRDSEPRPEQVGVVSALAQLYQHVDQSSHVE